MNIIEILTLIGVLGTAIGGAWYLRSRFASLERRLDLMDRRFDTLESRLDSVLNIIGILIGRLQIREIFMSEDNAAITGAFSQALHIKPMIPNPLTPQQLERLNYIINKFTHSQALTDDEIKDYNELVVILDEEKGDDPSVWPLVAFGALLLGIYLGSRPKKPNDEVM